MACKYHFGLSLRDEYVPEGYIPIYEIFSNSKYALPKYDKESWCIGQKQLKKMRLSTYHDVRKRFELCKASDYAKFWNGNLDAINELGINRFSNLLCFKELSTAMICFQTTEKNKSNNTVRKIISWGIKDEIYRSFYKAQKYALETGFEQTKVNMFDSRKSRNGNVFKLPDARLEFDLENGDKQVVKIKKNALYNQFEFWCKANGISKKDGIYKAIELLVSENPVKDLKNIGAYQRKCDLDYIEVLIPEQTIESYVTSTIKTPKSIHMKMREIIDAYNKDPDNIGKQGMNISKYVAQAIDLLNRKSPLKYSDPKAYQEYIKAKIAEQYNNAVSEL